MLSVLLHTAVWTRPPEVFGFDLSDCWAFLRYGSAISGAPNLCLRPEWASLNSHHKTILSDDLGVGLPTMLLCRAFKVLEFSDTAYVLNRKFPGRFDVGTKSKKGPSKLPDYVGRLAGGGFVVLECKGTQNDRGYLKKAMAYGAVQKKNLACTAGTRVKASLVGGAFIPQWRSSEAALVRFADPDWEEFIDALAEISDEELEQSIVQVAVAKQLALCGWVEASNALSRMSLDKSRDTSVDSVFTGGPRRLKTQASAEFSAGDDREVIPRAVQFSANSDRIAAVFEQRRSVFEAVTALRERSRSHRWMHRHDRSGTRASLATPLGLECELEVSPLR